VGEVAGGLTPEQLFDDFNAQLLQQHRHGKAPRSYGICHYPEFFGVMADARPAASKLIDAAAETGHPVVYLANVG
jgi:hypothetical protein